MNTCDFGSGLLLGLVHYTWSSWSRYNMTFSIQILMHIWELCWQFHVLYTSGRLRTYIYIYVRIYIYMHIYLHVYIYMWIVVTGTPVGKWQLATAKTSSSKWPIWPTYSSQFLKDLFILVLQVSSVFIRYLETRWNRPVRIYVSLNICIMFMSCSLILGPENWLSGLTFGLA